MNLTCVLGFALVLLSVVCSTFGVQQRRCFICRSRGALGDCKDSFAHNVTRLLTARDGPVTIEPCASGWCGKIIEGDTGVNDYDTATERMCMQRPPSDLQERCDETKYGPYRTVYLCMCYGDLCNSGVRTSAATGLMVAALAALLLR